MINYESELIENKRKILTDNFNANIEELKSNIVSNMLSNNELTLDLARKMIANLVVENAELENKITNLQTIEQQYSAILSENAELEDRLGTLKIEISRLMSKYFYEKDFCLEDTHLDKLLRIIDGDNILQGEDKGE